MIHGLQVPVLTAFGPWLFGVPKTTVYGTQREGTMTALPMAAYVRVSRDDQHPEVQLQELRDYAARRNVELVEYVDHGVSGRKDRRPALDAMMKEDSADCPLFLVSQLYPRRSIRGGEGSRAGCGGVLLLR